MGKSIMRKTSALCILSLMVMLVCVSIAQAQPDIPDGFRRSWFNRPLVTINSPYNAKLNNGKILGKECATIGACWDVVVDSNPPDPEYTIVSQDYNFEALPRIVQIRYALKEAGVKAAVVKFIVEKIPERIPPKTIAILTPVMHTLRTRNPDGKTSQDSFFTGAPDKEGRLAITIKVSTEKLEKVFTETALKAEDFGARELTPAEKKDASQGKLQLPPDEMTMRIGAEGSMIKSMVETQKQVDAEVAEWLARELGTAKKQESAKAEVK